MKYLILLLFVVSCTQKDNVLNSPFNFTCKKIDESIYRIERCMNQEVICYVYRGNSMWCMPRGIINE